MAEQAKQKLKITSDIKCALGRFDCHAEEAKSAIKKEDSLETAELKCKKSELEVVRKCKNGITALCYEAGHPCGILDINIIPDGGDSNKRLRLF